MTGCEHRYHQLQVDWANCSQHRVATLLTVSALAAQQPAKLDSVTNGDSRHIHRTNTAQHNTAMQAASLTHLCPRRFSCCTAGAVQVCAAPGCPRGLSPWLAQPVFGVVGVARRQAMTLCATLSFQVVSVWVKERKKERKKRKGWQVVVTHLPPPVYPDTLPTTFSTVHERRSTDLTDCLKILPHTPCEPYALPPSLPSLLNSAPALSLCLACAG